MPRVDCAASKPGVQMMSKAFEEQVVRALSRRDFVVTGGMAAAAAGLGVTGTAGAGSHGRSAAGPAAAASGPRAPFESLRDYLTAMDNHGLLARFEGVDQDQWEATAIMYHLSDRFGLNQEPVAVFENIKIDGKWLKGPLVGNHMSHHHQEALVWGLEPDLVNPNNSYRRGLEYMVGLLQEHGGEYPELPPILVARDQAPCKEVTLEGDAIDITSFAFIKGNPGDAGRYINTASTVSADPEWGTNFGTYRAQITGPRTLMLNSEPGQTGYRMFWRAIERGEKTMKIALILGQDPVTWVVSGSRVPLVPERPFDELAYVGGLRGKPIQTVKCDLSELEIPAHCEMVLEGELDLINRKAEGPYHEMYGYLGDRNDDRFEFRIDRITHRQNPIIVNSFTSIGGGFSRAPMDAYSDFLWKQRFPQIRQIYYHDDSKGIYFVSIRKDQPGRGMEIGKAVSERSMIAKLTVVVDDDLDVMSQSDMLLALGSRWQPHPASHIVESAPASFFEPSSPDGETTSKIVIDATIQWPEEGGPKEFAGLNRGLFTQAAAPDIMARVAAKWPEQLVRKPW